MSGEVFVQKFVLNGMSDSKRVVLYKSANHLRSAALFEEARTAALCLHLGCIILSGLDLEAQCLIMSPELPKNTSSKSFAKFC